MRPLTTGSSEGTSDSSEGHGPRRARRLLGVRTMLGLALVLAASICPAGSAVAAEAPGSIAGTVTSSATHDPIAGMEVCASPSHPAVLTEEEEDNLGSSQSCAVTGGAGEYTIGGLAPGGYWVVFNPPLIVTQTGFTTSQSNFISEAYNGAYTEATATVVTVGAAAAVTGIDAALAPGGEISGRVTAAAGGAAVADALVCAEQPGAEALGRAGCATTSASGEYTIYGLASGSYRVFFIANGYAPVLYPGSPNLGEATLVSVTAEAVTAGIDVALTPGPPPEPFPGGPASGHGGAPTSSTAPGSAGAPSTLDSGALLTLRSRALTVAHGDVATVILTCRQRSTCRGSLSLSALVGVRRDGRSGERREVLGAHAFAIAAGGRATIRIRLDRAAQALLRAGGGRLAARLRVALLGTSALAQILAVRLAPPPARR